MASDFADLFNTRGESGGKLASTYIKGLLSELPGKNMERMAERIKDANEQDLQQFLSDSPWLALPVWERIAQRAGGLF